MAEPRPPPEECANCGSLIPRTARACPECGADERTGWREASPYDDLGLPDEAYADDGEPADAARPPRTVNGLAWYWWAAGVCLLLLVLSAFVFP
jgi:hypothetical protein